MCHGTHGLLCGLKCLNESPSEKEGKFWGGVTIRTIRSEPQ